MAASAGTTIQTSADACWVILQISAEPVRLVGFGSGKEETARQRRRQLRRSNPFGAFGGGSGVGRSGVGRSGVSGSGVVGSGVGGSGVVTAWCFLLL